MSHLALKWPISRVLAPLIFSLLVTDDQHLITVHPEMPLLT